MRVATIEVTREEWVSQGRPAWQDILKGAEAAGDKHRAEYARWMLDEILVPRKKVGGID